LLDLLAKPALIGWANKLGLQGIDIKDKRKASLAKGSALHKQIEDVCDGVGKFEKYTDEMSFRQFMLDKSIVDTECDIETEWFVGRYDVKLTHNDTLYIADYKSGFKGKVYLENKLQLVAYAMAEQVTPSLAIVAIPQFLLVPVTLKSIEPYKAMLIKLSELYHLKKEIENE
jgi:hypothetical protein